MVVSGVWEGDFFSDSWHIECHKARNLWQAENPDTCGEWPERGDMGRGKTQYKDEMEEEAQP